MHTVIMGALSKKSESEGIQDQTRRLHFEVFTTRLHFQPPPLAKTWDDHLEFGRVRLVDFGQFSVDCW
jgi:hypothetical protein